jgi:hypothetical protein
MKSKNFKFYSFALALAFAMFITSCSKEDAVAPDAEQPNTELKAGNNGPSVNGHGTIMWPYNGEEIKRQFSFHAKEMKDGSIKGNGVLTYIGGEVNAKFEIDCMVINGNMATLSGMYTDHINPANIGANIWFQVYDYGEGANADPDMITPVTFGSAVGDCDAYTGVQTLYEVIGGNIQVNPGPQLKAGNSGPSANGHGTAFYPTSEGEVKRQFSFHANEMKDGSVQGSGVLTYIGGELFAKFDIDCLTVDGNSATVSGMFTMHPNPDVVGHNIWFKVMDNGEGNNADPDLMTWVYYAAGLGDCSTPYGYALNEVLGGNIQVKP